VSNFTEKYYKENLPSVHDHYPRYNIVENQSKLSLFQGQFGSASASTTKQLTNEEWRSIMLYVLLNSPEVEPYKQEFIRELWTASRLPEPHEIDTLISQGAGPQWHDFISWFGRKAQTDLSISSELCAVACGCELRVRSFTGYDVNRFRFHTTAYEESQPNRSTTNSGMVMIDTDGKEYHGRVQEIYELSFYGALHLKPVIFKCHWFDPECTRRTPTTG
jgi:hypothetical protein